MIQFSIRKGGRKKKQHDCMTKYLFPALEQWETHLLFLHLLVFYNTEPKPSQELIPIPSNIIQVIKPTVAWAYWKKRSYTNFLVVSEVLKLKDGRLVPQMVELRLLYRTLKNIMSIL